MTRMAMMTYRTYRSWPFSVRSAPNLSSHARGFTQELYQRPPGHPKAAGEGGAGSRLCTRPATPAISRGPGRRRHGSTSPQIGESYPPAPPPKRRNAATSAQHAAVCWCRPAARAGSTKAQAPVDVRAFGQVAAVGRFAFATQKSPVRVRSPPQAEGGVCQVARGSAGVGRRLAERRSAPCAAVGGLGAVSAYDDTRGP